jgi:hypothetical protein
MSSTPVASASTTTAGISHCRPVRSSSISIRVPGGSVRLAVRTYIPSGERSRARATGNRRCRYRRVTSNSTGYGVLRRGSRVMFVLALLSCNFSQSECYRTRVTSLCRFRDDILTMSARRSPAGIARPRQRQPAPVADLSPKNGARAGIPLRHGSIGRRAGSSKAPFSITYVLENGSASLPCAGHLEFFRVPLSVARTQPSVRRSGASYFLPKQIG